ncbi:MAG: ChaB family protein [Actinomycetota bacterium]|nr:ChaB family protein [Actinomycetota bacterium]
MPRSSRYSPSTADGLPGTLRRSCQEAQALFRTARAEAVRVYGEGDEANRLAYAALKQQFEKRGDHWIVKTQAAA